MAPNIYAGGTENKSLAVVQCPSELDSQGSGEESLLGTPEGTLPGSLYNNAVHHHKYNSLQFTKVQIVCMMPENGYGWWASMLGLA